MAQPPRKRQKQLVILSSSDAEESVIDNAEKSPEKVHKALSTRPKTTGALKTRQTTAQASVKSTPASSPKKASKSVKANPKEQRSGSLLSFFNAKTESQKASHSPESSQAKVQLTTATVESDDIIEDESTADEKSVSSQSRRPPSHTAPLRKHSSQSTQTISADKRRATPTASGSFSSQSQRFSRPALRSDHAFKGVSHKKDERPWAERYGPSNLEELAVHKKKVADVQGWILSAFEGRHRHRLLVLKGPSGTGKTATVASLSKAAGFEISEWQNPTDTGPSSDGFLSLSSKFDEFLGTSGKYHSLELETPAPGITQTKDPPVECSKNKVILIEDFPNTFTQNSTALHSFRSSLAQYLQAQPTIPLILIISETLLSSTTSASDSFTAHRLLGPDILSSPFATLIEYNPIAPTFLTKALELVIQKEARDSGRRRTPGAALLRKLGEVGDVRSAIGSLEFLCIRDDASSDWGGRVAGMGKGRKGSAKEAAMTKMEKESVEMVTQREATLGIFHAVGKVVYNKRVEEKRGQVQSLGGLEHLNRYYRPPLENLNLDTLYEEIGTDTSTFIAALHENYALSCPDMDSMNGCLDALSDADILSSAHLSSASQNTLQRSSRAGTSYNPSAVDNMRQEEITFHIAVRGILMALPLNAKREGGSEEKGRGDRYRMFYPMSLRLWRAAEEIGEAVGRWRDESWGLGAGGNRARENGHKDEGVESWARTAKTAFGNGGAEVESEEGGYERQGTDSRAEILLERMPFLAIIHPLVGGDARKGKELRRITRFEGVGGVVTEEDELEADDATHEAVRKVSERRAKREGQGAETLRVGRLALVEDDVEDIED